MPPRGGDRDAAGGSEEPRRQRHAQLSTQDVPGHLRARMKRTERHDAKTG